MTRKYKKRKASTTCTFCGGPRTRPHCSYCKPCMAEYQRIRRAAKKKAVLTVADIAKVRTMMCLDPNIVKLNGPETIDVIIPGIVE